SDYPRGRPIQHAIARSVLGEQRLDFTAQVFVASANFGQIDRALEGIPLPGGMIELLDLAPALLFHRAVPIRVAVGRCWASPSFSYTTPADGQVSNWGRGAGETCPVAAGETSLRTRPLPDPVKPEPYVNVYAAARNGTGIAL